MLRRVELEPIEKIVAKKKVTWVAHVLRGTEERMKKSLISSERSTDRWWTRYVDDLERVGLTPEIVKRHTRQPGTLKSLIKNNPIRPYHNPTNNVVQQEQHRGSTGSD